LRILRESLWHPDRGRDDGAAITRWQAWIFYWRRAMLVFRTLRKKRQEQEAKEINEYRDRFWREAQNTPTRPVAPLK